MDNLEAGRQSQKKKTEIVILKHKPTGLLLGLEGPTNIPVEQKHQRTEQAARVDLNPANFYEAQVNMEHCKKIGEDCGLSTEEVVHALAYDNKERSLINSFSSEQEMLQGAGSEQVNIDPTSEDELDSDGEEN